MVSFGASSSPALAIDTRAMVDVGARSALGTAPRSDVGRDEMGLLSGAAGQISADKALGPLQPFLVQSEDILLAFKVGRDIHALTSFRVLSLDVQGITGAKKRLRSIAYGKIAAFTVETAGAFDADAELTLIVPGLDDMTIRLDADTPIAEVQRVLAVMTLSEHPPSV